MAQRRVDRHTLVRDYNLRLVLDVLRTRGDETTRVELATATGLSKPTVNSLVEELEGLGLLLDFGPRTGPVGRQAVTYGLNPTASAVIGVDVGSAHLRFAVCGVDGRMIDQRSTATPAQGQLIHDVVQGIRELVDLAQPLRAPQVVVGTPGTIDPVDGRLRLTGNVPELERVDLVAELRAQSGLDCIVENDVNLATIGEHRYGVARGVDDVAFIAVGNGIGLGAIVGGSLLRGAGNAAGEIGYLPLGPESSAGRRRGAFEVAAAACGIRQYARSLRATGVESSTPVRADVERIIDAAADGDPLGTKVLSYGVALIARAVLAVSAVLDPALVVLGGGIGANPIVAPAVRKELARLSPLRPEVHASELGTSAATMGALAVGLDQVGQRLLDGS